MEGCLAPAPATETGRRSACGCELPQSAARAQVIDPVVLVRLMHIPWAHGLWLMAKSKVEAQDMTCEVVDALHKKTLGCGRGELGHLGGKSFRSRSMVAPSGARTKSGCCTSMFWQETHKCIAPRIGYFWSSRRVTARSFLLPVFWICWLENVGGAGAGVRSMELAMVSRRWGAVTTTMIRMFRIIDHMSRRPGESWLDWHIMGRRHWKMWMLVKEGAPWGTQILCHATSRGHLYLHSRLYSARKRSRVRLDHDMWSPGSPARMLERRTRGCMGHRVDRRTPLDVVANGVVHKPVLALLAFLQNVLKDRLT